MSWPLECPSCQSTGPTHELTCPEWRPLIEGDRPARVLDYDDVTRRTEEEDAT